MGKQINYWMDYESFREVAKTAVDLGCLILKSDPATGKLVQSKDSDLITKEHYRYYFYLPEAGVMHIRQYGQSEHPDTVGETGNALIEAGYSEIKGERKTIHRSRLYLTTGYYKDNGEFVYRPAAIVAVYEKLVRKVKKLCPYTEVLDCHFGKEWLHKEYISPYFLQLREQEGYLFKNS